MVLVWFGLIWFGLIWFDLVWFDLVWFGLVWFGLVWFGLLWFGLVVPDFDRRLHGVRNVASFLVYVLLSVYSKNDHLPYPVLFTYTRIHSIVSP